MPKDGTPAGLTVRHYCQGIGDCHLLKFSRTDGSPFWILIDCGIHSSISGGSGLVDDIVNDIKNVTGGRLDVLVLTHEHTDHNSAFDPGAARFDEFTVGEVWMAWTESKSDPQALALDKFKQQALSALSDASQWLNSGSNLSLSLQSLRTGVDALLNFSFGVKGERVRAFREYAESLTDKGIQYLEPTRPPMKIHGLPNLRVFVLAPSRDEKYLQILERAGEMYRMDEEGAASRTALSLAGAMAANLGGLGAEEDPFCPFDLSTGSDLAALGRDGPDMEGHSHRGFARNHYFGPAVVAGPAIRSRRSKRLVDVNETDQSWRRIDHDWLASSGELAMQLDNKTNNTSLVLAFELVDSGRVFLFAADAQVGNWLSWGDTKWKLSDGSTVTGPDLLGRTVYYKVGHHGSQNATLEERGLELMTSPDLAAFIPTNEIDAKKVKWGAMPFGGILGALNAHCGKRVIRADDAWKAAEDLNLRPPTGCIHAVRTGTTRPEGDDPRERWIEFDLK